MGKGINLAVEKASNFSFDEQQSLYGKKCVFLSHRRADKSKVIKIGDYIMYAGFNIYLDINDKNLQDAILASDAKKVTMHIQLGLMSSDYILCIISGNTFDKYTWWVPYEIGYADKSKKECCLLKLDNVNKKSIPEYLKIKQVLFNITDLNNKLKEWHSNTLTEWSTIENHKKFGGLLNYDVNNHTLLGAMDKL